MVSNGCKFGALDAASSAIRYGHIIAGMPNPMDDPFLKSVLEGAKRIVGKGTLKNQKEPLTTEIIKSAVDFYRHSTNLLHYRFIVVCLIGFSGFLRISELLEIHVGDLTFDETSLRIIIPKSKNDQVREGHLVFIYRSGSPYCPVTWLQTYLAMTKLDQHQSSHIICRLAKTRTSHNAIGHRPLSDVTVRDNFKSLIAPLCTEGQSFSLHSLRSGGASTAINSGVSERLIGKHGRWKSGFSRDGYLKDDKKGRLSVTQAMNL